MTSDVDAGMLSAVVDAAPTPLWVIQADGAVALANRAAVDVLGYRSVGDVIGAPSHDLLHDRHPDGSPYPAHACPIVHRRDSAAPPAPEWFITRAGQPIAVNWSIRPLGVGGATLLAFTPHHDELAAAEASATAHTRAALRANLFDHVGARFRDPDFTPARLAAEVHLSLRTVQQVFAEAGCAPASEIRRLRVEFADALIARGVSVHSAGRESGFRDTGTFGRAYRRRFGRPPSGGRGRTSDC